MASFVARFLEAAGGNLPDGDDYFEDDDGLVHEDAINSLAALGIVQGVGSARFDPKSDVDRAQTAALLARTFQHIGVQLPPNPGDAFADDTGSTPEPANTRQEENRLGKEGGTTCHSRCSPCR